MNRLIIKLNTITENVTSELVSKLYTNAKLIKDYEELNEIEDSLVELLGNLQTPNAYDDEVTYLETKFPNLHINITGGRYVKFEDPAVLSVLATTYGDGTGVTLTELSSVSEILLLFKNNTDITKFNEFKYFTGITTPAAYWLSDWFSGCTSLTEITIPKNVRSITEAAFLGCTSLHTVTFDTGSVVESIQGFKNCSSLTNIQLPNTVQTLGQDCFNGCTSLTSLNTSNITSIANSVFAKTGVISLDLSNVTSIGRYAFQLCTSITSVGNINKVTSLGEQSLAASNLVIDDVSMPYLSSIEDSVFATSKVKLVSNLGLITAVGYRMFFHCYQLTSVTLPLTVTSIGYGAFDGDSALTSINLSNITSIANNAFYGCSGLTSIDLSSCTSIGNSAFLNCTSLQTVSGFSNITSLNDSIFYGCTNLLNINGIDWSKITKIESNVFYLCSNLTLSNVNLSNVTVINNSSFAGSGITNISNISSEATVSSKIFSDCKSLTSATNINKVGNSMFKNCSNLTTVSIGSSISNILGGLFENCSNLVSLDINFQNITNIESNVFLNCSKLEFSSPIDLSNVTSIGISSFQNCSKVIIDKFPKASIYLQLCFSNIGNTTITIPKEVQQLKNLCFSNNVNLQTVLFEVDSDPQLVSQLTNMLSAFKGCSNLEGPLSIPEGVTTLNGMNFQNCSKLTSVTLPSTLTSMGIGEFLYSGVKSLTIKATTPPTITNQSLGWMSNSLIIYVPSESVSAYLSALYWNSYASKILAIP